MPQYRTAAQWRAADPVLLRGELAVESDTRKFKFGDGTTTWNNLGYVGGGNGGDSAKRLSDALEITDFGDFPDTTVFEKPGDIVPIHAQAADGGPANTSGNFVGMAQAWEAWVTGGAENWIMYLVMDTETGKTYSGKTLAAGGGAIWAASGTSSSGGGMTPVDLVTNAFPVRIRNFSANSLLIRNIDENDTLLILIDAAISGTRPTVQGKVTAFMSTGNTFYGVPQTLVHGYDLDDDSIIELKAAYKGVQGDSTWLSFEQNDPGDLMVANIVGIYKLPGNSGGGGEIVTPDEYYLTVNGKTATGNGVIPITLSPDSDAQVLELPFTTNGTLEIAEKTGSFLTAQIVGEEAEIGVTENSGTIQVEISANTGSLRNGSVTLTLAENNDVRCMIAISQDSGGGNPNNDAVIHVDCYDTGLEAGQEIFLVFEIAGLSENYDCVVPDDKEILIKFSEMVDILGFDLLGCAGDSLTIRCPNIDASDTQTIPDDYVDMTFHFI